MCALLSRSWRSEVTPFRVEPEDLSRMVPYLLQNGAGGLALRRIRAADSALAESKAALPLAHVYRLQSLRAELMERTLADILPRLTAARLSPLVAKGPALERRYPERGLR